jgi:hypothetical protein
VVYATECPSIAMRWYPSRTPRCLHPNTSYDPTARAHPKLSAREKKSANERGAGPRALACQRLDYPPPSALTGGFGLFPAKLLNSRSRY